VARHPAKVFTLPVRASPMRFRPLPCPLRWRSAHRRHRRCAGGCQSHVERANVTYDRHCQYRKGERRARPRCLIRPAGFIPWISSIRYSPPRSLPATPPRVRPRRNRRTSARRPSSCSARSSPVSNLQPDQGGTRPDDLRRQDQLQELVASRILPTDHCAVPGGEEVPFSFSSKETVGYATGPRPISTSTDFEGTTRAPS